VLVGDRPVVGESEDLVALGGRTHLGDADLDLVGLGLLGENRPQGLRVGIGQPSRRHVGAVVGVAAQIGIPDAGDPQVLELVVHADGSERDAVVDLGDLAQALRVLRDEDDAPVVLQHDDRAAAGDALARVVGLVLHQLLG
jgi:hypothetical protein